LFSRARVIGKVDRYAWFHSDTRHTLTSYAPSIGYTWVPLCDGGAILAVVIPAVYLIEKINRPALNNSPCVAFVFLPSLSLDTFQYRISSVRFERAQRTLIARVSSIGIELPGNPAALTRSIQPIASSVVTRDYPTKNQRGRKIFNEPGRAITPYAARIPRATLSRTSGLLYDPEILRLPRSGTPRAVFRPAIFHYGS